MDYYDDEFQPGDEIDPLLGTILLDRKRTYEYLRAERDKARAERAAGAAAEAAAAQQEAATPTR